MRNDRNGSSLGDNFSLSGWIYADLLLALMVIFLASVTGVNPLSLVNSTPNEELLTGTAIAVVALPTNTPTPDFLATDIAINDMLATSVAATMEAIIILTGEPTSTAFPTPIPTDNVEATQTVLARQIFAAMAATLTAAPTATNTNTPEPTLTPSATSNLRATQTAFARSILRSVNATLTAQPTPSNTTTPTAGPTPTPAPTSNLSATETAVAQLVVRAISATLTAEPTPTLGPTDTPGPSPTPRATLDLQATETAIAEVVISRIAATLTAVATGTTTPVPTLVAGLSRDPVEITLKSNADALLAGDRDEVLRLRGEILALFSQYSGIRQAGIVLTFGTSPDPNEGNDLSGVLNGLLTAELPSVFGNAVLNSYHTISGDLSLRGDIEVQVYLVSD